MEETWREKAGEFVVPVVGSVSGTSSLTETHSHRASHCDRHCSNTSSYNVVYTGWTQQQSLGSCEPKMQSLCTTGITSQKTVCGQMQTPLTLNVATNLLDEGPQTKLSPVNSIRFIKCLLFMCFSWRRDCNSLLCVPDKAEYQRADRVPQSVLMDWTLSSASGPWVDRTTCSGILGWTRPWVRVNSDPLGGLDPAGFGCPRTLPGSSALESPRWVIQCTVQVSTVSLEEFHLSSGVLGPPRWTRPWDRVSSDPLRESDPAGFACRWIPWWTRPHPRPLT